MKRKSTKVRKGGQAYILVETSVCSRKYAVYREYRFLIFFKRKKAVGIIHNGKIYNKNGEVSQFNNDKDDISDWFIDYLIYAQILDFESSYGDSYDSNLSKELWYIEVTETETETDISWQMESDVGEI